MADLKINIVVDDNGAVQKLNEIEAAEKRVKAASDTSASSISSQARGVILSFQDQERGAVNAARAAETLATSTENVASSAKRAIPTFSQWAGANNTSAKAMADYIRFAGQASAATETVAATATEATSSVGGLSMAAGGLGVSAGAMGIAIVGAATALGVLIGVVADSAEAYIQQSDEMAGVRDELKRLAGAWNDLKLEIGEAVLGGTAGGVVTWLKGLEIGIHLVGAAAAEEFQRARSFFGLFMPVGTMTRGLQSILGLDENGNLPPKPAGPSMPIATGARFTSPFALDAAQLRVDAAAARSPEAVAAQRRIDDANARALQRAQEEEKRALDELTGATTLRAFDDFTRRIGIAGGLTMQTTEITKRYANVVFDVIEKQALLGDTASKSWDQAKDAALKAVDQLEARIRTPFSQALPFIGSPVDVQMSLLQGAFGTIPTSSGVPLDPFTGTIGTPIGNEPRPGAFDIFNGFLPGTPLPMEAPPQTGLNFGALLTSPALLSLASRFGASQGSRSAEQYLGLTEQLLGKGGLGLFHAGSTGMAVGGGMASLGLGLMMNSQGKMANAASGALTGAGIGTMIMPGIGTAVGAGVGAIAGYIKGLLSQAGRNLVKQYADSMGGFDALHAQLNQLGDDGEQLWIKLTQGVGHANASQAKQVIGQVQDALQKLQDRIDSVKKAVQDLSSPGVLASLDQIKTIANAGNTPDEQAALQQFYTQQTGNAVGGLNMFLTNTSVTSQETASGAVGATLATFQLLQNQGLSMQAIVEQIGPIVQTLTQQLVSAGLQGGDTFGTLIHYVDVFSNVSVQHASDALTGLIQTETALANVGALTNDTFAGLNHAIVDTSAALQNQGLSGADIQLVLHPALQRAWELEQDFHVQADAGTQALIDQAVAAGTVGEAFRDPMQQLTDAIKEMTNEFRQFLGLVSNGLPAAAQTGVAGANRAFGGLNPGGGGGGEAPEPGDPGFDGSGDGSEPPKVHTGGHIWRRMHIGGLASDEVPIIAQTGEFMMSRRGVAANGRSVLERMNRGERIGSSGDSVTNIYLDGEKITSVVARRLPGAVRDIVPRYS